MRVVFQGFLENWFYELGKILIFVVDSYYFIISINIVFEYNWLLYVNIDF